MFHVRITGHLDGRGPGDDDIVEEQTTTQTTVDLRKGVLLRTEAVIFLSSARQPWAISSSDEFFGGFLWLVDCDTCTLYLPTLSILSLAI